MNDKFTAEELEKSAKFFKDNLPGSILSMERMMKRKMEKVDQSPPQESLEGKVIELNEELKKFLEGFKKDYEENDRTHQSVDEASQLLFSDLERATQRLKENVDNLSVYLAQWLEQYSVKSDF